jgi:hypothetical protein
MTQDASPQRRNQKINPPIYDLFRVANSSVEPMVVNIQLNGKEVPMEVDTGASRTVMGETTFQKLLGHQLEGNAVQPSKVRLRTYTGEQLQVLGAVDVRSLKGILQRHTEVFSEELGHLKGFTAKIHVDPDAVPQFCNARPVPYALRKRVEQELSHLEAAGVIKQVEFSDWAAPIMPVTKQDGSVRISGDYQLTVNRVAKLDTYPLPRIEDLFASLSGGQEFTKLDLAHAYQQISLDEASKKYLVINTHKGLFQYNHLSFGVASAPAIFQKAMEGVLRGIDQVSVYIDDILVTGKTKADHLQHLDEVLTRLREAGLHLKKDKCAFLLSSVEYLGHTISANGLHPTTAEVRAIRDAPTSTNLQQLRSFLGLINYYSKFLPHLATTLSPLYQLMQKSQTWIWGKAQADAFAQAKAALTSAQVLAHYDPDLELILDCDASPYGIGAVLSHRFPNGQVKPVAFASCSLAVAEKNYSQLDKEALAIVFGVKRFHQYLAGCIFTIFSDHKPLQHIFAQGKPIPAMASARIQRWALTLNAYKYTIVYRPGSEHGNADLLSRLPLPEAPRLIPLPGETVNLLENLQSSLSASHIKTFTARDPTLSKVMEMVLTGWSGHNVDEEFQPFNRRRNELSLQDGCLLWGNRVVVPSSIHSNVLEELHAGHPGISRMKGIARGVVWWPGIDASIEEKVKACEQCQLNQKAPAVAPLHPWEWPDQPWSRLHIDYAGPFLGKMFLVVVDAHSKWLEIEIVPSATSANTIEKLCQMFATHGIPDIVVSDNGTAFTSGEFKEFLLKNGIRHVTSSPYHPSSNGLAERYVQTFKRAMKKDTSDSIQKQLARFLFRYRSTPHTTTGTSPAQLLMGRRIKTHLDQLYAQASSLGWCLPNPTRSWIMIALLSKEVSTLEIRCLCGTLIVLPLGLLGLPRKLEDLCHIRFNVPMEESCVVMWIMCVPAQLHQLLRKMTLTSQSPLLALLINQPRPHPLKRLTWSHVAQPSPGNHHLAMEWFPTKRGGM